MRRLLTLAFTSVFATAAPVPPPVSLSGIYPHLAMWNSQGECGTGAVVPWADKLWVVTYSPHQPRGSDDKLYSIDSALRQTIHPESIGGTPANRFIHRESQQLFIGPYAVDAQGKVRAIPFSTMFGRPTGNARHLTDPANKIYTASMEEGFYEVDIHTLAVTELFRDEQVKEPFRRAALPGYHGKGLYSGQGVLVYANNGENSPLARTHPDIPSGALAEWDGKSDTWTVIRRNQFTEVTGPGGLAGNPNPATDPIWSIGWDHRSLILMVRDASPAGAALRRDSAWHSYRLPKSSHSYDGAHGWNTEWPRIRDIGENDLLMTMHGAFWRFPKNFDSTHSAGIAPRSNYLKVVGDFARCGDKLVLGTDDTAKSEFLNKRRAKGKLAAPGQSQSNLWFIDPAQLDRFGPPIGRGAVWQDEAVTANAPSDAFLFSGFDHRLLHLAHDASEPVTFTLEVDRTGNNTWTELRRIEVPAAGYVATEFTAAEAGAWVRIRASRDCAHATATFTYRNRDARSANAQLSTLSSQPSTPPLFHALATPTTPKTLGGLLHARGAGKKTLGLAVGDAFYEMGPDLVLRASAEPEAAAWMQANVAIPRDAVTFDAASIIYTDEQNRRWRLPRGRADVAPTGPHGFERTVREVCTERDLLNTGGTFFELPAENAGGVAKVRAVATHNRHIHDYATWRGLFVMTGLDADASATNAHVIRSTDGKAAVWAGSVDDLWSLGKPVGIGGPWQETAVQAGAPSEPYLLTGYDRKKISLSHTSAEPVRIRVEVDLTGNGQWVTYRSFEVAAGQTTTHNFPASYQAYWLRTVAESPATATAQLTYD
jgi:hypothetical protein